MYAKLRLVCLDWPTEVMPVYSVLSTTVCHREISPISYYFMTLTITVEVGLLYAIVVPRYKRGNGKELSTGWWSWCRVMKYTDFLVCLKLKNIFKKVEMNTVWYYHVVSETYSKKFKQTDPEGLNNTFRNHQFDLSEYSNISSVRQLDRQGISLLWTAIMI